MCGSWSGLAAGDHPVAGLAFRQLPPHMLIAFANGRIFFCVVRVLSVSVAGSLWCVLGTPCTVRALMVSTVGFLRFVLGIFAAAIWFWGRQGWGLGIPQPKRGCRIGCRYPRVCAWVRGSSGQGAWHPPALPWVPYRLPVSSRLSGASGVHGARGLASPGPFLGAKAGCVRLSPPSGCSSSCVTCELGLFCFSSVVWSLRDTSREYCGNCQLSSCVFSVFVSRGLGSVSHLPFVFRLVRFLCGLRRDLACV